MPESRFCNPASAASALSHMDNRLPGKSPQQHFLSRHDIDTAAIIETDIAILQQQGRSAAEAYLREQGIGSIPGCGWCRPAATAGRVRKTRTEASTGR